MGGHVALQPGPTSKPTLVLHVGLKPMSVVATREDANRVWQQRQSREATNDPSSSALALASAAAAASDSSSDSDRSPNRFEPCLTTCVIFIADVLWGVCGKMCLVLSCQQRKRTFKPDSQR